MRLTYDKESGALYFKVREGRYSETLPLAEPGFGASLDLDEDGYVLGAEFLSTREMTEFIERMGGALELPVWVEDPEHFRLLPV